MEITQIRNATLKIEYGGVCFLVDSWLQDVGSITSFVEPGTFKNPIVPLPMPVNEVLTGVDGLSLTCCLPQSSRNVHDCGAALASARGVSGRPCVDYGVPTTKPVHPLARGNAIGLRERQPHIDPLARRSRAASGIGSSSNCTEFSVHD